MKSRSGIALVFCLAVLVGCEENQLDSTAGSQGQGTLVVKLTDAPGAYDAVNIVVDSIRVHYEGMDTLSGWYTVSRTLAEFNLLALANGKDTVIANETVPAGTYSQIRLYIGQGSTIVVDGAWRPLEVPSGAQSGLKLNAHMTIAAGMTYELVLDFDAARSIVETGSGHYQLKPVIRVVTTALSGVLSGVVQPAATRPMLLAIAGTDTTATLADLAGTFTFKYLSPTTSGLKIIPTDVAYRDTTLTNLVVTAGATTSVGTVTLQLQ